MRRKLARHFHIARYLVFVLTATLLAGQHSDAAMIQYEVVDLPDPAVVPGQDHWQYRYHVSEFSFQIGQGFDVFFDVGLYEDLEDPPPAVNTDWDVQAFQPDLALPDDGFYDAVAQTDVPSLSDIFIVTFVWTGTGTPGPQRFEIFDTNFSALESGQTVPVPEPATWIVMFAGLVIAARRK